MLHLVILLVLASPLGVTVRSGPPPVALSAAGVAIVPTGLPALPVGADIVGTGWGERRKRFQELAVCGLSSANVTYLLLTGISGPGAVIGLGMSIVGVIVCL